MISDRAQIRAELEAGIPSSDIILRNEKLLLYAAREGLMGIHLSEVPELLAKISAIVVTEEMDMLTENNGRKKK